MCVLSRGSTVHERQVLRRDRMLSSGGAYIDATATAQPKYMK